MKEEIKTIYRCDHCNKVYFRKHFCVKHEIACFDNPENYRVCFSCKFLNKKELDHYYDNEFETGSYKVNLFHCQKLDSCLYPPTVEHKKNMFYSENLEDEIANIPMKKECNHFDSYLDYDEFFLNI